MKKYLLILALGIFSVTAFAMPADQRDTIKSVGKICKQVMLARIQEQFAVLYAKDAILYPTFENKADTPEQLLSYFKKISANQDLQVKFNQEHIRVYDNVAINSGLYTFSYQKDGQEVRVPARYTFVYLHEGDA